MTQNIFLFYGEDNYSLSQKLKLWRQEFAKKYGEDSIEVYEGKGLNIAELSTNIEALPFFSEKRLIILKDFLSSTKTDEQKQFCDNLDKIHEQCLLLFYENEAPDKRTVLFKKIQKLGKIEEFKAKTSQEIAKWILEQAKKQQLKINFTVANYLSQYCKPDLWIVANELEKLKLSAENQEITKEMVETICIPSLNASVFKLTDSLAQRKSKETLQIFSILHESGEDLAKVFFMIVRHFRILLQVHDLLARGNSPASITKKLAQHPFVIQKTSQQSKNFSTEKLAEIYQKLLQIDIKTKTGVIKNLSTDNRELALAIEHFIIDCCAKT